LHKTAINKSQIYTDPRRPYAVTFMTTLPKRNTHIYIYTNTWVSQKKKKICTNQHENMINCPSSV